jgi:hypothetical protein
MDAFTIRQLRWQTCPCFCDNRRAMAEEMETPDPLAVNRMITASEPLPSRRHSRGSMA